MNRWFRRVVSALVVALAVAVAGCSSLPPGPALTASEVPNATDPAIEARILALDPEKVSDADVREALAHGPTPRIVLMHGGVYPVHLAMESFAEFLVGMGYPLQRIRNGDGSLSLSPYASAARQAGEIAWYYEHEGGARPMMVGHSQGGIQAIKILQEFAGWLDDSLQVVDPATGEALKRTWIVDPLTGQERPVVGLSFAYVSVVGTGGWSLILPHHWAVAPRIREVPDNVDSFTGYRIGLDLFAMDGPGFAWLKTFSPVGHAEVRNVTLPAIYSHVLVPITAGLAEDPAARAWINAYAPKGEDAGDDPDAFAARNIVWAADVWWSIKKAWVLEAQRVIEARRRNFAAGGTPPPAHP